MSALVGCGERQPPVESGVGDGALTLVIEGEAIACYTVSLDKVDAERGVLGVIEYLGEIDALSYEMSGTMLTRIGELANGEGGRYIYVFTSVAADHDVSQYAKTAVYGDMTLGSTGVGIEEMTVEAGMVIYIALVAFVW